jgi:Uma2 family endonuclease
MSVTNERVAQAQSLVTAEQFFALAPMLGRCELIAGRIVKMSPGGGEHGVTSQRLSRVVGNWVEEHELGETVSNEPGFQLATGPDTVRAPDLCFIAADRVPEPWPPGWLCAVPSLVLEVAGRGANRGELATKVGQWLGFGVQVVWVLSIADRCLIEHRSGGGVRRFGEDDMLVCEDLLPGFTYPLRKAFRGIAPV